NRMIRLAHALSSFFNTPAPTEIYTLSLHDALPISISAFTTNSRTFRCMGRWYMSSSVRSSKIIRKPRAPTLRCSANSATVSSARSEEHTSELQSRGHLVCRLLLEKKNQHHHKHIPR